MNRKLLAVPVTLAVVASPLPAYAASEVDLCPAERYEPCSFFKASLELGDHEQIIDNHVAGFTRSEGSWTIGVRYQPETQCARIDIVVDMGPLDIPRQYREGFRDGAGKIRDSGTFMHRIDDLEDALGILSSSCRVPKAQNREPDTAAGDGGTPDEEERERLALEREREQLALKREQERLALARERLALEQDIAATRVRERLERERARRLAEQERERERLALERALEATRERERLAQQRREQEELERLEAQRDEREREDTAEASVADAFGAIVTGLGLGVLAGAAITGDDEAFDAAAGALTNSMTGVRGLPGGTHASAAGGSGCEGIGARLARDLDRLSTGDGMCSTYRGYAAALTRARRDLASAGCATGRELADLDQKIRQTEAGARAAC